MLKSIIESFLNLDPTDREKCLELFNNFVSPIKIYLIFVLIILFLILCTNIYIITKHFQIT